MPLDKALLIGAAAREGGALGVDDAQVLFAAMLAGEVAPRDLARILTAWRRRGASPGEVTGFVRALDAHAARLDSPPEGPGPVVLPAYRGTRRQANLTALLALLLKRYEIPVLLHGPGRRDAAPAGDEHGTGAAPDEVGGRLVATADVLWELGIEPAASLADAQARLRHDNIAYLASALLAPGLAALMALPSRDPLPPVVGTVALLIDPFRGGGYRVIGAASVGESAMLREFLLATRTDALLFEGAEGEPFADPRRQPRLEHITGGIATPCAEAEGDGNSGEPALPAAPDAVTTAAWIANVLAGTEPVPPPIVVQLGCCLAGARRQGAAT
jgi:anthranilate phosphoribosyltransferase